MWSYNYTSQNELYHHGIKGQKWGVRRYQYSDGTWTAEGKIRYGSGSGSGSALSRKDAKKIYKNVKTITDGKSSVESIRDSRNKLSKIGAYQKAVDELTEYSRTEYECGKIMSKIETDYFRNDKLYTEYKTLAAKQDYEKHHPNNISLDTFTYMYVNDEFDPNESDFKMYLNSNKDLKKKYASAKKTFNDMNKKRTEAQEKIGRDLLGDNYDKPLYKTSGGYEIKLGQKFMFEALVDAEKRVRR